MSQGERGGAHLLSHNPTGPLGDGLEVETAANREAAALRAAREAARATERQVRHVPVFPPLSTRPRSS